MAESNRINEWLKCGTNLPVCWSQRAIEFALRVIASADECANSATGIVDDDHCAFQIRHRRISFSIFGRVIARLYRMMKIGLMLDFGELCLQRVLRGVLHGWIKRGVDRQTAVIDLVLCQD